MPNPLATTWVLGMHILDSTDGVMYGTASYELHPNFANNSFYDDYDFTIVEVDRRIEFNHNIKPICLPTPGQEYSGHRAIVSGWGRLNEGKDARLADSLMETGVTVLTDEQCTEDTANLIEFNTESMICAFALDTDACQVNLRDMHVKLYELCFKFYSPATTRETQAAHWRLVRIFLRLFL